MEILRGKEGGDGEGGKGWEGSNARACTHAERERGGGQAVLKVREGGRENEEGRIRLEGNELEEKEKWCGDICERQGKEEETAS